MTETCYLTQRDAADAVAKSQGWVLREDWSVLDAGECTFWFDGQKSVVEQYMYSPFCSDSVLRLQDKHNLTIKPTFRTRKGKRVRLWHVQSAHDPFKRGFMSVELWDAVAQWRVGYNEFQQLLRSKVDCV